MYKLMRTIPYSLFLVFTLTSCGISSTQNQSTPAEWGESVNAGKEQANLILNMSLDDEYKQGAEFDKALKDPSRKKEVGLTIKCIEGTLANTYVNRIGESLARNSFRPDVKYKFQIVEESSVNAFATMGGYVYIHTGLIKAAANEAQLAAVMAHEIAHIAKKHTIQAMASQAIYAGWSKGAGGIGSIAVQLAATVLFQLPGSRSFEFEADMAGMQSLRQTGYAPIEMVAFYRDVLAKGDSSEKPGSDMLSTHPDTGRRIEAIEQQLLPSDYAGKGETPSEHEAMIKSLK